ncbi:752_t:CDS:2 [Acaulospora morrowiae]|uniref:HECT-type E3 ubiquitin transferase n=1 Tax=Acaulospora morrowiae TaxID=94023 RepID=A0A9N9HAC9_9GLOM|nr:752_t:CDS:2 [Acaulospora morrowiae]
MDRRPSRRNSSQSTVTSSSSRGTDPQQRRITRALAHTNQEANNIVDENLPQPLRYFYRDRHQDMTDQSEPMDIDEPVASVTSEPVVVDNVVVESSMMNLDQPADSEVNPEENNNVERDNVPEEVVEHETDSDEDNEDSIPRNDSSMNEEIEEIVNPRVFLSQDIRETLRAVIQTNANSEQLGKLANFFLMLERTALTDWNLDLLISKLAQIVKNVNSDAGMPFDLMFGQSDIDPAVLQSILESNMSQNDPNIITMATRCLGNLVTALGDSAGHMVSNPIKERVVPLFCDILVKGPQTNDSEHLKDIIMALYQFTRHNRVDCTGIIVEKHVFPHIWSSIFPFLTDNDRILPIKLLSSCCQRAPLDSFSTLLEEAINVPDFQSLFADHELPDVIHWCCLSLSFLVSRFKGRVDSLTILLSDDVVMHIIKHVNGLNDHNQLRLWNMFTILAYKSRPIISKFFQLGIGKAIYEALTRKPALFLDDDDSVKVMIKKVQDDLAEVEVISLQPHNLYRQIFLFLLALFPALPKLGSRQINHVVSDSPSTTSTGGAETSNSRDMVVDSEDNSSSANENETTESSLFKKPSKQLACLLVPTLIKTYRGTENWESRKLIVAIILAFVLYLDDDLMCEILQQASIEKFLRCVFTASSYITKMNNHILDMQTYALEIVAQCLESWGKCFGDIFNRSGVLDQAIKLNEDQLAKKTTVQ